MAITIIIITIFIVIITFVTFYNLWNELVRTDILCICLVAMSTTLTGNYMDGWDEIISDDDDDEDDENDGDDDDDIDSVSFLLRNDYFNKCFVFY